VGKKMAFQLLQRRKGSILPEPATSTSCSSAALPPAIAAFEPVTASGLTANVFAKFAVVGGGDATALWRNSALELAAYAALVTSEGGLEAAQIAPYIYSSLDSLAHRARRWGWG
jgi:hypothetical protein